MIRRGIGMGMGIGIGLFALACSGGGDPTLDAADPADAFAGDAAARADADVAELTGVPPPSPKPLIPFTVTNRDGTPRTEADLLGHPTVLWFYPSAYTTG